MMGQWGNADFKDLVEFQRKLEKLDREMSALCEECLRELAARLLRKVKLRTPVGKAPKLDEAAEVKVTGAGGKIKTLRPKSGAVQRDYWAGYVGGTLRRNWTIGEITRNGAVYMIEVINPTEYASYVEYGHRQTPGRYVPALGKCLKKAWVPGKFMLTISEQEIQKIAPALTDEKLQKKLQEVFRG